MAAKIISGRGDGGCRTSRWGWILTGVYKGEEQKWPWFPQRTKERLELIGGAEISVDNSF